MQAVAASLLMTFRADRTGSSLATVPVRPTTVKLRAGLRVSKKHFSKAVFLVMVERISVWLVYFWFWAGCEHERQNTGDDTLLKWNTWNYWMFKLGIIFSYS